jgi:hypothetical protein
MIDSEHSIVILTTSSTLSRTVKPGRASSRALRLGSVCRFSCTASTADLPHFQPAEPLPNRLARPIA